MLLTIIVVLLIAGLSIYGINLLPIAQPFKLGATLLVVVAAILYLASLL